MHVKDLGWGVTFFAILVLSLIFNGLFMVVFFSRRRLNASGHFTVLVALSFVDTLIAGSWTGLSAAVSIIGWELPVEVCRLQSYLLTLTQTLTAFILATVSLERLLRMVKPSRHTIVFVPKVTAFLIFALIIFCGVISSIHLYGTIPTSWHSSEHQCGADFVESIRLLDMTFCFDHAIPFWIISLPTFVAAFVKVLLARRNPSQCGEIVLEKNAYAPDDSYTSRLSKLQSKFGGAYGQKNATSKVKSKKPTLGKRGYSRQGYTELEHWDSDIEDGRESLKDNDSRQRTHSLPRPEYSMLFTAAITTLVTALLWFPWIIARFIWTRTPRDSVPDWFAVVTIACMHCAAFIKPVLYFIINPYFRSAVAKTLCCKRKSEKAAPEKSIDQNTTGSCAS